MKLREIAPIDLFSWLRDSPLYPKLYWANREGTLRVAGVGSAPLSKHSHQFGWRLFESNSAPEWSDFSADCFFLPRFELIAKEGRMFALENGSLDLAPRLGDFPPIAPFARMEHCKAALRPSKAEWLGQVDSALQSIRERHLEKVVLARKIELRCPSPIDPIALCRAIEAPGQTVFFLQKAPSSAFLGASPERLYKRTNRRIECDALAGTRAKDRADELLQSEKDIREFHLVKDRILESLSPLCEKKPAASADGLKFTPTLCHLYASIEGHLKDGVRDDDILDALHPTPAVGGWPKDRAVAFLSSRELFARGLYAAPIGWRHADEAEFAVGIRSCLVRNSEAHLYAGTGIVHGSDPELEWEESQQKLSIWNPYFST